MTKIDVLLDFMTSLTYPCRRLCRLSQGVPLLFKHFFFQHSFSHLTKPGTQDKCTLLLFFSHSAYCRVPRTENEIRRFNLSKTRASGLQPTIVSRTYMIISTNHLKTYRYVQTAYTTVWARDAAHTSNSWFHIRCISARPKRNHFMRSTAADGLQIRYFLREFCKEKWYHNL